MATAAASRRSTKAAAAERAAKERRQILMVAALGGLLVIVLAFELPGLLSRGGGSSSPVPATTTLGTVTTPAPSTPGAQTAAQKAAFRRASRQAPHDVFFTQVAPGENTLGAVANPPGLHDPFASPGSPESSTAPAAPKPPQPAITGTIVIGTPGAGTVAVHGWIVILASIPTSHGKGEAESFAKTAQRNGVGSLSILNSSNRRPLRGGYWVVYTGPVDTLAQVNQRAAAVHARGFSSAYIRQLIVYKKK